ncbi:MAG: enoyl-CoA hydratase [Sterolibacterium sp.]|nr:enoyl-CoA hydratase [Sterolibacterium sp.]
MNEANSLIVSECQQGILRVEICRPEKKNALTNPMYSALADIFEAADRDKDVRVVLIHGQPKVFTSGNDLGDFLDHPPLSEVPPPPVFRFINSFRVLSKPFIAAVSGAAIGIGTTMLLHCDLAYAGESAKFQLPFVNLGLCPEASSSLLLPMLAGHARAAEILLFGEPFSADKALEIGLVNAVLPDASVLEHALARARKLVEKPAASVRLTKQLMKRAQMALIEQTIHEEGLHFRRQLVSPEAKEAFAAFLEKRKPDFSRFA